MKYQLNQPVYPQTSGCGGPADCATKQMLHSSKVQNQINNMNGGAAETGPAVPNVVGASEQQNNLFAKVAKLTVDQQENSKYDHETGKGPIKGGKRRTKKRSNKIKKNKKKTKSRRKGGRKSRAKSLSQPRSHAQFMGNNLDYAGHFPAKQGGKTSRRTRKAKKGGNKDRSDENRYKRQKREDEPQPQSLEQKLMNQKGHPLDKHEEEKKRWEAEQDAKNMENMDPNTYVAPSDTPGKLAPRQNTNDTDFGTDYAKRQNLFGANMIEEGHNMDWDVASMNLDDDTPFFGGKKRRTRKRHGKGPGCSKYAKDCIDNATLPKATSAVEQEHTKNVFKVPNRGEDPFWEEHQKMARNYPVAEARPPAFQLATPVVVKHGTNTRVVRGSRVKMPGGKKKTKKFKKHYMWNTKGKRYMAKTHKQHMRGVKLGHTHKKPKKSKRRTKKRCGGGTFSTPRNTSSRPSTPESTPVNSSSSTAPIVPVLARVDSNNNPLPHADAEIVEKEQKEKQRNRVSKVMGPSGEESRWDMVERTRPSIVRRWVDQNGYNSEGEWEGM